MAENDDESLKIIRVEPTRKKLFLIFFHVHWLFFISFYRIFFSFCLSLSCMLLQKFVQGLSILSRGTLEEKLCWTFSLYDINCDGQITKEEMTDIVTAIYNLMGHPTAEEKVDDERIKAKVDRIFEVSSVNLFPFFFIFQLYHSERRKTLIHTEFRESGDIEKRRSRHENTERKLHEIC